MMSSNFHVKVPGSLHTEVEALAKKNYIEVSHEFLKSVHSEALFSQLFDQAFTPLCKEPGILTSKLFDLMSLFGQDLPKNHLAD